MDTGNAVIAEPAAAGREIVLSRVLRAERERVWKTWADPGQLALWWGPNGSTLTTSEFAFGPGGRWLFVMHGPDGKDYPNAVVYEEVVAPERIVYAQGSRLEGPEESRVTATFQGVRHKTVLTLRCVFPTAAARDRAVKERNAIEGGQQTLERLAVLLARKPAFELVLEREIAAHRARVFEAWTRPEQLARWFAPQPYRLIIWKMDLRHNGRFSMTMRGPDGKDMPFTGTYREISVPSRLFWTGEFAGGPADQMSTLINFLEQGSRTKVHVRQTFHVMTPEAARAVAGAREGWTKTLDQLEAFCARVSP